MGTGSTYEAKIRSSRERVRLVNFQERKLFQSKREKES